jgi:hemoglobin
MRHAALGLIAVFAAAAASPALAAEPWAMPGEEPVDAYTPSDANAGATPFAGTEMFEAFHGKDGIARIVKDMLDQSFADPRSSDIFKAHDRVRLERTLNEQFCYILGGGCAYTGRDMKSTHKDMGLQASDMNILVEHLQLAMDREGVPFRLQNRFLAKLAPMKRDVVER